MQSATANRPPTTLGQRIRDARVAAGLSREGLAFKADVSLKTVERAEGDVGVPRRATLKLIADALGLDLSEEGPAA